ncbi:uncharacterized protein CCR75_005987 [Bremia lactucae]|uniref:Uncharacterized protein n=1 Tax=Bremia lactucae TaxID=4779 RepID=A0A976IH54_BRELC|nr:hypothetical protein CCR75_005987 [Bremia lactucae]
MSKILQRVHLLGRFYLNKWQYDATKWLDDVWFGRSNRPRVASVAFMITHSTRQKLLAAGFPSSVIRMLQPTIAQKIIADNIMYDQFKELQEQHQEEQAERARRTSEQMETQKNALAMAKVKQVEERMAPSAALVIHQTSVAAEKDENK